MARVGVGWSLRAFIPGLTSGARLARSPPTTRKLLPIKEIEIPRPSREGMVGFVLAWVGVGRLIWLTKFLASLGA